MVRISEQYGGDISRLVVQETVRGEVIPGCRKKECGLVDNVTRTAYLPEERVIEKKLVEVFGWSTMCDAKMAFAYLEDDLVKEGYTICFFKLKEKK
ncbi:hypothetical protein HYS50_03935 [Candidatus Woesearchaeota archaeon]|nr:hypothetical protein [Candidatus Woesearchaeota archaeon]